jgi:hypothetical protein
MTSFRQFEANRRNARHSTGPRTDEGKRQSRLNAVRHGLTAETVIASLEDAEDYKAFEAAIIADYCAETAVARELVLRLASLLWRLRRATAIDTDLLALEAEDLKEHEPGEARNRTADSDSVVWPFTRRGVPPGQQTFGPSTEAQSGDGGTQYASLAHDQANAALANTTRQLTLSFLRVARFDNGVFERLNRYEAALWRQAIQIIFALHSVKRGRYDMRLW